MDNITIRERLDIDNNNNNNVNQIWELSLMKQRIIDGKKNLNNIRKYCSNKHKRQYENWLTGQILEYQRLSKRYKRCI